MSIIPADVRKQLEEAGIKFDENGNIIGEDETFFSNDEEDQDDLIDPDEDEDEDEGDDDQDDENDSENGEDEDEDDDPDDDDDEEDEPVRKPKKKAKEKDKSDEDDSEPKLTPRELKKKEEEEKLTIDQIRENMASLLESYKLDKTVKKDDNNDEEDNVVSELRREVEEFRRLRYQTFADTVKSKVRDKNYGVSFQEIISSSQWDEFLATKAYGRNIGELYKAAVQSQDTDAVLFFFDDFASRYLKKSPAKVKEDKLVKQDDLDDLAVPDKTKTSKTPRRKKYDFEENDYAIKLDEAERGIISREEFIKFNDAFEAALSKGRVKPSR